MAMTPVRPSRKEQRYALLKKYELALGFAAVAITFGFGVQFLPSIILSSIDNFAAVISSTLVDLTNTDRAAASVVKLKVSPLLEQAAQAKANDMATNGYFAHNSPMGVTPWHWFAVAGYDYSFAGENLAIDFFDSAQVEKAWMNSPLHRANIMNGTFTEIGIATATGTWNGHETTFVVQMFGRPLGNTKPVSSISDPTVFTSSPDFEAAQR